uniref:Uncharacterized protein n=2 Tax=Brassica oleracea var. oleracea TaxID=109376 RepID=A0A0D3AQ42_BRAOL
MAISIIQINTNRGCKAMYVSGGATITVLKDGTGTTRIYAAKSVHCTLAEKNAYVMFSCNTGGAMRMNIVIKGVHNVIEFLTYDLSDMNVIVISSECGCFGGAQYAQEPDRLCCCRLSRWILTLMPTTYCFIYHGLHFQVGTLRKKKHSFRFNRQRNMHGGVGDEVKESCDDSGMSSFSLRKLEEARAYIYRLPKPTQKAAKFDYTWRILANWEQGGNHQTSLDEEIGDPEDVEMVDSRQYMEGFRDDCNKFIEFS